MSDYRRRTTCRACGSDRLAQVLDLGEMPPANAFLRPEDVAAERRYPLTVALCEACSLLQVPDVVDPAVLFKDYKYATGSAPLAEHFRRYAHEAILPLVSNDDLVVDIGGNDGTLLSYVKDHCGKVLNIDPAAGMLNGGHSVDGLFDSKLAKNVRSVFGPAKVITANNVLAHVDDPLDFVRGVRHLLADDGVFICEVQWVKSLLDDTSYDHVYHEHLSYWSLHSLIKMLNLANMIVFDAFVVPVQGESLRVFASKDERYVGPSVTGNLFDEEIAGLGKISVYRDFATRVQNKRRLLRDLLYDLKDGGATIIGYGAPAKGSTLLNYCGIDRGTLDYVVDGSKAKQGLLTPGTHVPVVTPDRLLHDAPDYALLLSWNYRDHVLEKEHAARRHGTKFIVPVPRIEIV